MPAKFEILQPRVDEFRWVLTSQGRVLARSGSFTRKASCLKSLESFRTAAPTADVVDATTKDVTFAPPATVPARAARTGGRLVGRAAAKVVEAITPSPRQRTRRA
ncbi:MAG TPA: YegP family protein [Acidimicrobiia bacterium]|nr:YegP family protein [Acidimicrobiia bacterium]